MTKGLRGFGMYGEDWKGQRDRSFLDTWKMIFQVKRKDIPSTLGSPQLRGGSDQPQAACRTPGDTHVPPVPGRAARG